MMSRLERLSQAMQCDAAVVTGGINRRYLTGFSSMAGTVLLTHKENYLIVDSRYIEAAQKNVSGCTVLPLEGSRQLAELLQGHGAKTVGFDAHYASFAQATLLAEQVAPARLLLDNDFSTLLLSMRSIKDAAEINCLSRAQEITDQAFAKILPLICPGTSELEVMMAFGEEMARLGCEKRSFSMIFTSGSDTSLPHGNPEIRTIQSGDLVMVDVGAGIGGYSADMTRTVAVASVTAKQREVYETVLEAQRRALAGIRPGVVCRDVDALARDYINASPYAGLFGHGLGHSLGLEIHEEPRFNQVCTTVLEPGMVITVEPGIYLPQAFGVRIEDMVVVTETGCCNLTQSPKELLVLS